MNLGRFIDIWGLGYHYIRHFFILKWNVQNESRLREIRYIYNGLFIFKSFSDAYNPYFLCKFVIKSDMN